ncbi:MAG: hypothetical protein GY797_40750 [Deltaproteobacteria bacterium]|nr:hypothetical protein [Deltaproteobacteria bacterium]
MRKGHFRCPSNFIFVVVLLLISSCSLWAQDVTPSCSKNELPVFLGGVRPLPAEIMDVETYHETKQTPPYSPFSDVGIGVVVRPSKIDRVKNLASQDHRDTLDYYSQRSMLYLNGHEVSTDTFSYGTGLMYGQDFDEEGNMLNYDFGPYHMLWFPQLSPGNHEAKFHLVNKDQEEFEFTWCFTII